MYFNDGYRWYNAKTVFAPQNGGYTVSLNKYNVRICYRLGNTKEEEKSKEVIKRFILEILDKENTNIVCSGDCDVLNDIAFVNKIQLR